MKSKTKKPVDAPLSIKTMNYIILIVAVIVSLFPFYVMFVSATRTTGDILSFPPKLTFGANLAKNFAKLNSEINVGRVLFNSLFISIIYTVLTLILGSAAGYALAKFKFKGKQLIFSIIMVTLMIPGQVLLVPLFSLMNKLGWVNSYQAVILPALANAFGIFLMRQNMVSFPDSLIEAARIDGCNELSIFLKIVLPNMKPALGALGIYMFMSQWNNFMWPLIVLSTKDMYTFPIALASLNGLMRKDYGAMMLGSTIATLPIMITFLIFQKQFIAGILGGSVKE